VQRLPARGARARGALDRARAGARFSLAPARHARCKRGVAQPTGAPLLEDDRMKKALLSLAATALLAAASTASATSSTTFWTPATTYVQPYLVPHITYDSYVAEKGGLQNDYGLTVGVLPFQKLQGELGVDSFLPGLAKNNLYLNGKLVLPEGAFGSWQPGLSVGAVAVGFKKDVSDYNVLHGTIAKTLPVVGNVAVGGYYGLNDKLMVSADGTKQQAGVLAAWTSPDLVLNLPGLHKINFVADVQTGDNVFGAWGAGVGLYFTPAIDLLTGPVFFNDSRLTKGLYGSDFMWSVQLDVDFDLVKKKT
jgi:hypothetical protein